MSLQDYYRTCLLAKPEPRKRTVGREKRSEAKVKRAIRAEVAERDQTCRVEGMAPAQCGKWLEWAHLRPRTRAQTRGMDPAERHTTRFTAMLCWVHHDLYDASEFDIHYIDPERGADGPIEVVKR